MENYITRCNGQSQQNITMCDFLPLQSVLTIGDMDNWQTRARQVMREKGITQDMICERMGVTQGAIAHWLAGRRGIDLESFMKLAKAIDADSDYLLTGRNHKQSEELIKMIRFVADEYREPEQEIEPAPPPRSNRVRGGAKAALGKAIRDKVRKS